MSSIKSPEEIEILREGGKCLARILASLADEVRPGVSAETLDALARRLIAEGGDTPSFLNYRGKEDKIPFPAALCVSVNDEVVHGVPHKQKILREGDIVGLDLGLCHRGLYTDAAVTVAVGKIEPGKERIISVTEQALAVGIHAGRAGATTGDVGSAIESFVRSQGDFGIVRDLAGHGVGHAVHESPIVPNYGKRGEGTRLEIGMVLAIEPMLTLGGEKVVLAAGFAYRTKDGSISAHFEHTVVVTERGCEVLTQV